MFIGAAIAISLSSVAQLGPLTHRMTLSEGLDSPARIAVTAAEILVVDPRPGVIRRFDASGGPLGVWFESGGPVGVAVHPDGRIFVSRRDATVAVYDSTFTFQQFLGSGVVAFVQPTDLAVDPDSGLVYVVDSGADRVYAFDAAGALALMFGTRGSGFGQFKYPSAIALDAINHRILVADQDNFRVQVFDTAGVFRFSFGYRIKYLPDGTSEGWFARTAGLAVDAAGRIYVTDAVMGTMRVFDPRGAELGKLVGYGAAPGNLQTPCDVALDATGRVLIANSNVGAVEIYDPLSVAVAGGVGTFYRGTNDSPFDAALRRVLGGVTRLSRLSGAGPKSMSLGAVAASGGWEPPHMLSDTPCARCHDIDGEPGGHEATVAGQSNLCLSCHTSGGHALDSAFRTADRSLAGSPPPESAGRSHAWGVPAINALVGSEGPPAGSELARRLSGGQIKCGTCHNQHNNSAGSPYLRVSNRDGAMCKQCHVDYVGHTPHGSWQPTCAECHDMHNPDSSNLSLVATSVYNRTLGADKPVVFSARTGANSFDDGNPAADDGICQVCHTATSYHRQDGSGTPHNNGTACTMCHPHEAGFMPTGGACDSCHGAPPLSGAHLAHAGGDVSAAAYGGTSNLSAGSTYVFQCGNCHPLSPAFHRNGVVNIELFNAAAPVGSLKSLNPPAASYTPGGTVYTDLNGLPYTLGSCSNVYCHSKTEWSSPDPISQPLLDPVNGWAMLDANGNLTYAPYTVTTTKAYATVNWGDSALGCNACHRNNPQTSFPNVQAGVGNSHGWIDDWGYENFHAWNMSFEPLTCRVCHYNTVRDEMTWTRDAWDITYFDDVPIADKAYHVNGVKDVVFDAVNPVIYRAPYSLAGMTYDPQTKVCSNTPCHLNQTSPEWGKPYRWGWGSLECDQCHRYGGPWPPTGGNASVGEKTGVRASRTTTDHSAIPRQACPECHIGHRMVR